MFYYVLFNNAQVDSIQQSLSNETSLKGLEEEFKSYTYLHKGRKSAFNQKQKIYFSDDKVYLPNSIDEIDSYRKEVCKIIEASMNIPYMSSINTYIRDNQKLKKMNFGSKSVTDSISYVMDDFKTSPITDWLPQINFSLGITIFKLGENEDKNALHEIFHADKIGNFKGVN
ncbi:MAG: hypothetical protein COA97_02330 [Flavobacteriales bacterium]|nr:MAG: hypothetical protein COA97_02330 [Flavobacteriales bacterium]